MDKTLQDIRDALATQNNPDAEFLTSVLIDLVDIIKALKMDLSREHTMYGYKGAGRW